MSFRGVLVGVVMALVLLAAGLVWAGRGEFGDLLGLGGDDREACTSLDTDERTELLGVETPVTLSNVEGSLDAYSCRWSTRDYKTSVEFVQAVSAPADDWANELARALQVQPPAGDRQALARLRKAAARPLDTPEDGCRFAAVLFEMGGAKRGAQRHVAPTATETGAPMMIAQSCVDGTYSAVMVAAEGLQLDSGLQDRTAQALLTVESRLAG